MMFRKYLIIVSCLFCFILIPVPVQGQMNYTIQSFNRQNFYVSYHNVQGIIYPAKEQADKELATFIIRKGLAAPGAGYISLEAAAWPGYYLRNEGRVLKLQKQKNNKSFLESATFKVLPGLANSRSGWFSLSPLNHPELFIRHKNSLLLLEINDGSRLFKPDATFRFIPPLWDGKNKTVKTKTPIPEPIGNRDESILIILGILGFFYLGLNVFSRLKEKKHSILIQVKSKADPGKIPLVPEAASGSVPDEGKHSHNR